MLITLFLCCLSTELWWQFGLVVTVQWSAELSPVSTTRVDGPSWRVTSFHYPSTWAMLTGNGNRSPVNSGSGNRAFVLSLYSHQAALSLAIPLQTQWVMVMVMASSNLCKISPDCWLKLLGVTGTCLPADICHITPRLHLIHVARKQVVSTCIPWFC